MGISCSSIDIETNNETNAKSYSKSYSKNEPELTSAQDEFLSQYKMTVHANTDPINRSSVFKFIEEEYKEKYNNPVPISLYKYYNCS